MSELNNALTDKIAPWPCLGACVLKFFAYILVKMANCLHMSRSPFTGSFRFINPGSSQAGVNNTYGSIVEHLKVNENAKVLDLGCCFGHDARQLLKDGVRPSQIVACDLLPELINYGFELFGDEKDQGHLKGLRWEKVDVFNQEDIQRISQPNGYYAIYTGSFIHLFPLKWQEKAVAAMKSLLSKEKGSQMWGRQVGVEKGKAGPKDRIVKGSRGPIGITEDEDGTRESPFYHDVISLKKLFEGSEPNEWDSQIVYNEWEAEKGTDYSSATGEVMIASDAQKMLRLKFVFSRK